MMKCFEVTQDRSSARRLCHYRNVTSHLQVAIICQGGSAMSERIIFPGESWLFEASPDAELQIQTRVSDGVLTHRTGCDRFQVKTPS